MQQPQLVDIKPTQQPQLEDMKNRTERETRRNNVQKGEEIMISSPFSSQFFATPLELVRMKKEQEKSPPQCKERPYLYHSVLENDVFWPR